MPRRPASDSTAGRFAYGRLDRTIHERARLGIVICLAARPEGVLFGELKRLCALTDGNLSRHLDVLHDAGIIEIWKGFEARRPQTLCRLSSAGRQRFTGYLDELARVLRDAEATGAPRPAKAPRPRGGWQRVRERGLAIGDR
jgi:DNA-binding transcriptional ArsR family regulator